MILAPPSNRGSVLIVVLWVTFGLVSMALYFAHTTSLNLRTADNRVAASSAQLAIDGAVRYLTNILATAETPGALPDPITYRSDGAPVGDATFWIVGRSLTTSSGSTPTTPVFGLTDETSRINLNTATAEMLQWLPRMTPQLAAAIVDWRDSDSTASEGGAEDDLYLRLPMPYRCKNSPFESVEELRLVYGMTSEILYGEDSNLNGVLDPNENDGDESPPADNRDGRLDPGLIEYTTVWSYQPTTTGDGSNRVDLASNDNQALATLLQEKLSTDRANAILRQLGNPATGFRSVLEFYIRSQMTAAELALIETNVMVAGTNSLAGLINVNTAPEPVLACIPGIGTERAPSLVARRASNDPRTPSIAWVTEILDTEQAIEAGPYLTGHSYQFTADIVGVGHHDRGFRRSRYVCDLAGATPRIAARRDLTDRGWPLGAPLRAQRLLALQNRR
ncbi:MAG: general secretion pathway protein GspK [Verrucomicrobiales bacterium]|nr:general secretion pathway protein GspK [Verrucomicrobiales bacterium]